MRRWVPVLLGVAVVGAAVGIVGELRASGDGHSDALTVVAPAVDVRGNGDATALVPIHDFRAGQALSSSLEVFAAPASTPGTTPTEALANPTHEGFPLVVSVIDDDGGGSWLQVRLPERPNGATGWVRAGDVQLWEVPNRIVVSVGERTLRVFQGDTGNVLFQALVAVGTDRTPTPLGDFFIDIVNPLGHHPTYGWGQLSVSGFSEVLDSFGGGIGQIAIHGWNDPSAMGRNVSNGCVRMNNDDIARVAELSPLGTPVQIVA